MRSWGMWPSTCSWVTWTARAAGFSQLRTHRYKPSLFVVGPLTTPHWIKALHLWVGRLHPTSTRYQEPKTPRTISPWEKPVSWHSEDNAYFSQHTFLLFSLFDRNERIWHLGCTPFTHSFLNQVCPHTHAHLSSCTYSEKHRCETPFSLLPHESIH